MAANSPPRGHANALRIFPIPLRMCSDSNCSELKDILQQEGCHNLQHIKILPPNKRFSKPCAIATFLTPRDATNASKKLASITIDTKIIKTKFYYGDRRPPPRNYGILNNNNNNNINNNTQFSPRNNYNNRKYRSSSNYNSNNNSNNSNVSQRQNVKNEMGYNNNYDNDNNGNNVNNSNYQFMGINVYDHFGSYSQHGGNKNKTNTIANKRSNENGSIGTIVNNNNHNNNNHNNNNSNNNNSKDNVGQSNEQGSGRRRLRKELIVSQLFKTTMTMGSLKGDFESKGCNKMIGMEYINTSYDEDDQFSVKITFSTTEAATYAKNTVSRCVLFCFVLYFLIFLLLFWYVIHRLRLFIVFDRWGSFIGLVILLRMWHNNVNKEITTRIEIVTPPPTTITVIYAAMTMWTLVISIM